MIRTSRAATAAALLPIALLVAACGGSTASGSAAASSAPVASATSAASSSAGAEASSGASAGAFPSFDLSSVLGGLQNVDSYQETITIDGKEVYSATVVTKPVLARSITASGTKFVLIGDKAWMSQDGTTYQAVTQAIAAPMIGIFDPAVLIGAFGSTAWAQGSTDVGAEQKNGVSAHHYRIDSTSPLATQLSIPANGSIDIWIADDGYLVAVETTGFTGQKTCKSK
jgi:hypothetical protein